VAGSLVVACGVGSRTYRLTALNVADGKPAWQYHTRALGSRPDRCTVTGSGSLVLRPGGSTDCRVIRLDRTDTRAVQVHDPESARSHCSSSVWSFADLVLLETSTGVIALR